MGKTLDRISLIFSWLKAKSDWVFCYAKPPGTVVLEFIKADLNVFIYTVLLPFGPWWAPSLILLMGELSTNNCYPPRIAIFIGGPLGWGGRKERSERIGTGGALSKALHLQAGT